MSDLEKAYAIDGPDEARALYRDWAETYDESFGAALGYAAPRHIAGIFRALCDGATPVLDVGAGTGLLAEHLGGLEADALDFSPEMLAVAARKGIYRRTVQGDLTGRLPLEDASYGGVVSSGTFTHGHVGPVCLPELLRVTRPGALFVCGTIPAVYDGAGFGSALARLQAAGAIGPLSFREYAIYDRTDHDHGTDRGLAMIFRKV